MRRTAGLSLLAVAGLVVGSTLAAAPGTGGNAPGAAAAPLRQPAASGPGWRSLTATQQRALQPLRPHWDTIDTQRKEKWIEVADRFAQIPAGERQRVQERMVAWAEMSPAERARARVQFQETRRIGADERHARWLAYKSLPEDERRRLALAAKSKPAARPSARLGTTAGSPASLQPSGPKRNIVVASPTPLPRAVTPTVVQAKPGASTTTVATRAKPPLHHQPGLPKVVATPGFVDPATLLPRRGPQAAAMRTAAVADSTLQR